MSTKDNIQNDNKTDEKSSNENIKNILNKVLQLFSAIAGFLLTFSIWNFGKMNSVLVSCANSLIASLVLPRHEDIFFSGSLGGISSSSVLINYGFVVLSAVLIFIVFNLVEDICKGFGGRLGTIAFISNSLTTLIIYFISYSNVFDYTYPIFNKKSYDNIDIYVYIFAPILTSFTAVTSYLVFEYVLVEKNKCTATTMTGLSICLLLSLIKTPLAINDSPNNYGELMMIYVDIGLLAGLAKVEVFSRFNFLSNYNFHHFMIYGYIAGWIGIGLSGVFNFGGRHGFTAFTACNVYIRFLQIVYKFKDIKSNNQKNDNQVKQIELTTKVIVVNKINGIEEHNNLCEIHSKSTHK